MTETLVKQRLKFAWLEITGKCSLSCSHCYADSGPRGTHGDMTLDDWKRVMNELKVLGLEDLQFIGGEPTMHPQFTELVEYALSLGFTVEVFTHLSYDITEMGLWTVFEHPRVRIATSYYSDTAAEHDLITRRKGSWQRTTDSIAEIKQRGLDLRVGIISLSDKQRTDQARDTLVDLGMPRFGTDTIKGVSSIGYDEVRGIGRGVDAAGGMTTPETTDCSQLCGNCGQMKVAIAPNGVVWPCIMARSTDMTYGNVLTSSLIEILDGASFASINDHLATEFEGRDLRPHDDICDPGCGPACTPQLLCNPPGTIVDSGRCDPTCYPASSETCGPCAPHNCITR